MNMVLHKVEYAKINLEYAGKLEAIKGNILIESIYSSHIKPVLDQVFSEYLPAGIHLELPKIEIDIGRVPYENMSKVILEQINKKLRYEIELVMSREGIFNSQKTLNPTDRKVEYTVNALRQFLHGGTLPVWIPVSTSINDLLITAITENPSGLRTMLLVELQAENGRLRLIESIKPETFDSLINLLWGSDARTIIVFRDKLARLLKNYPTKALETKPDTLLRSIILEYISLYQPPIRSVRSLYEFGLDILQRELKADVQTSNLWKKVLEADGSKFDIPELNNEYRRTDLAKGNRITGLSEIISALNSGRIPLLYTEKQIQEQLSSALRDKRHRLKLIDSLNEQGRIRLLDIFNTTGSGNQIDEWSRILKIINQYIQTSRWIEESRLLNALVVFNALYGAETGIGLPKSEQMILLVSYLAGHNILDKPDKAVKKELLDKLGIYKQSWQKTTKDQRIAQALKGKIQDFASELYEDIDNSNDQIRIGDLVNFRERQRRRLVSDYILRGYLSGSFERTQLDEIRFIFNELLIKGEKKIRQIILKSVLIPAQWNRILIIAAPASSIHLSKLISEHFEQEYLYWHSLTENQKLEIIQQPGLAEHPDKIAEFISVGLSHRKITDLVLGSIPRLQRFVKFQKDLLPLQALIMDLLDFSPASIKVYLDKLSWHSLVLQLAISEMHKKELSEEEFLTAFAERLWLNVQTSEQWQALIQIRSKIAGSGNKNLKRLHKSILNAKTADIDLRNYGFREKQQLSIYVQALRFFGRNSFMPWWSTLTIGELISELEIASKEFPQKLQKQFTRSIPDGTAFHDLFGKLGLDKAERFKQVLIEIELWKEDSWELDSGFIPEKRKTDISNRTDLSTWFKSPHQSDQDWAQILYQFTDDEIIDSLDFLPGTIRKNLKLYLSLNPYFYLPRISPTVWRKEVYSFVKVNQLQAVNWTQINFDREFQRHLSVQRTGIDWRKQLRRVNDIMVADRKNTAIELPAALKSWIDQPSKSLIEEDTETVSQTDKGSHLANKSVRVNNAGLVLLAPFLTTYFDRLKMLEGRKFIDFQSKKRAVYLLQYLAFGSVDFEEFQLSLNKALLGLSMGERLEKPEGLTDTEKSISRSLLEGVRQNWEKLKNSSIEGLQETFLQREGVLEFDNKNLVLRVEKKGVDVLLSNIPWNYRTIKLAWMENPIHVEWN